MSESSVPAVKREVQAQVTRTKPAESKREETAEPVKIEAKEEGKGERVNKTA